jgi:hypothetical protein
MPQDEADILSRRPWWRLPQLVLRRLIELIKARHGSTIIA